MKILAVVSMLIDHTAIVLFPRFIDVSVYMAMRAIGRFAFPVFAFLIVNGYERTRDVKRYLTRLLAFAVISQIPYVLVGDVNHFPEGNALNRPSACISSRTRSRFGMRAASARAMRARPAASV